MTREIDSLKIVLKPSETSQAIRAMHATKLAPFLWGPPGIAKSAIAQSVADEMGIAFVDIRLSQMDPTDLRGMPFRMEENGVHGVRWAPPVALPRDLDLVQTRQTIYHEPMIVNFEASNPLGSNGIRYIRNVQVSVTAVGGGEAEARIIDQTATSVEAACFVGDQMVPGAIRFTITGKCHAIVALEEFNSAPMSVLAASYQLILDRRLGEYIVPDGAWLMALGNRETDKGVVFKMPSPILNRFVHVEMACDFNDWQVWALGAGVHPQVVGYLSAFKHKLFEFEPSTALRGFATPRSWNFVSTILHKNEFLSEQIALALFIGCVGEGTGAEFNEFRKIADTLPKTEEILSGRLKKLPNVLEIQLAYALTTSLCYELRERINAIKRKYGETYKKSAAYTQWNVEANRFLGFMMDNFTGSGGAGPEICIMGARAAIQIHKLPFNTKSMDKFDEFTTRYQQFLI